MQVRKLLVLTSVLALFVVAPGAAVAKPGGTDRPIKGAGTSTTTIDIVTGAATTQGTAIISHLGKSTFTQDFTITPTGPTTFTQTGTVTLTAANGDQLFATLSGGGRIGGLAAGDTTDVSSVFTITGGTGRFADASGTITSPVFVTVVSLVGTTLVTSDTFTLQGRISY
jgi:hypothetical protein